jgi:hypothetical protein
MARSAHRVGNALGVLLTLVIGAGCEPSLNVPQVFPGPDYPLGVQATINGATWESGSATATTSGDNLVTIYAGDSVAALSLTFHGTLLGSNFSVQNSQYYTLSSNYIVGSALWTAETVIGSGTLTITSTDSTSISGYFTLQLAPRTGGASGTINITNGTFHLGLQHQLPGTPPPGWFPGVEA